MPKQVLKGSAFFKEVLEEKDWVAMVKEGLELKQVLRSVQPFNIPQSKRFSETEINAAVRVAIKRLPKFAKAAGLSVPTAAERVDLERVLRSFLRSAMDRPRLDPDLLAQNDRALGWKQGVVGRTGYFTVDGVPAVIVADIDAAGSIEIANSEHDTTAEQTVFFLGDIIIEVLCMIIGLVGISIPSPGKKGVSEVMRRLMAKNGFKEAMKRFLTALKKLDVDGILEFIEFLDACGMVAEFFAHLFAGLSKWDYLITAGKFLCWLAALLASGGAALAAKITGIALDMGGIIAKAAHADDYPIGGTQSA